MTSAGRQRTRASAASRRSSSISTATRGRSTCCWRWRASRRSTSPRSRSWRWPTSTSPSSPRSAELRLEIAADYLVMAAWLAYLKSRLLLPEPPADDEARAPRSLAAALGHRLRLLAAMQRAGAALMARPLLGRDVFPRGAPEGLAEIDRSRSSGSSLYELLRAYGDGHRRSHERGADDRAPGLSLAGRGAAASAPFRRPCAGMARAGGFLPGGPARRHCSAARRWPRPLPRPSS